jgi:hypothetical protein
MARVANVPNGSVSQDNSKIGREVAFPCDRARIARCHAGRILRVDPPEEELRSRGLFVRLNRINAVHFRSNAYRV